jgi:hypothetical protein
MSDAMSFTPRFPWNDDERDTRSFIQYYANEPVIPEDEYVPTYIIMREYFKEQQMALSCDECYDYDYDDNNNYAQIYYEYEDDMNSDVFSTFSCTESLDGTLDDAVPKSENNDDENASSPFVSNKYWYM